MTQFIVMKMEKTIPKNTAQKQFEESQKQINSMLDKSESKVIPVRTELGIVYAPLRT